MPKGLLPVPLLSPIPHCKIFSPDRTRDEGNRAASGNGGYVRQPSLGDYFFELMFDLWERIF